VIARRNLQIRKLSHIIDQDKLPQRHTLKVCGKNFALSALPKLFRRFVGEALNHGANY
jgi:hypothetical protein